MTTHSLLEHDCRDLSFIPDASIHLIISHPPAFSVAGDGKSTGRFPAIPDYEEYMAQLDPVWSECVRVLAPGGYLACIVDPATGHPEDPPVSFDIQAQARCLGLEVGRTIRWLSSGRVELDDGKFYGQSNQPCGAVVCDSQDVLVMRKPGERDVSPETRVASRMAADYFATCSSSVWLIPSAADRGHPRSFPVEVAERLIRMLSFAGDTVLDPFAGLGATSAAAMMSGRNSVAVEVEPSQFELMAERMASSEWPEGDITIARAPFAASALTEAAGPARV